MWIFTKDGFFSVVEDKDDASVVIVQARRRSDLESMLKMEDFPGIVETQRSEYPFIIYMDRKRWTSYVAAAASKIDYTEFHPETIKEEDTNIRQTTMTGRPE